MGLLYKCVWPVITLVVAAAAILIYFFYPPVCTKVKPTHDTSTTPSVTTPQPTTPAGTLPWEVDYQLPDHVYPTIYQVELHPDLTTGVFSGTVIITVNVTRTADYVLVHIDGLTVDETRLTTATGDPVALRQTLEYKPNQFWVIVPQASLQPELHLLTLRFRGSMTRDIVGMYMSAYTDQVTGELR